MKHTLHLAKDFALPIDLVTQTIGILAKRGAGKSYTAAVLAEELLAAELPVVVVDPVGVFWGLRAAANGRDPGLPILIIGGDHGDVPLEATAGELVADLVVDERISAVLDLSLFRKGEQVRLVQDFAERLYQRNRQALHLVLDEADAFAPQRPMPGEQRLLGAIEDLVRRGRARGIGLSLITQRAAVLNKNVLTQAQVLVTLRTIAPQDRDAIDAWVEVHGTKEQRRELMDSLAALPTGTAWWWSPGWPTGEGIFRRVEIRRRRTFDSSATPEVGAAAAAPKKLAAVDLEGIRKRMAGTLERARANDPRELRRRVAELQRELAAKPAPAATPERVKHVEVEVVKARQVNRLAAVARILERRVAAAEEAARVVRSTWQELEAALGRLSAASPSSFKRAAPEPEKTAKPAYEISTKSSAAGPVISAPGGNGRARPPAEGLSGPEQRILDALAWLEVVGQREARQAAAAFLAGYTVGGGAFNNPRGTLRTRGLIEYRGDRLTLTDAGRQLARAPERALTAAALQARVLDQLPGPEGKILRVLLEIYPRALANEELANRAGYSPNGGAYNNPRGRLRSLGLIDYREGQVVALPVLFLED